MANPSQRSVKSLARGLFLALPLASLICVPGYSQAAPPTTQPAFQAADIHSSPRAINPQMRGGLLKGERYEIRNATMVDLISNAYSVAPEKVAGGPSWLENDRFDIAAKAPSGTTPEILKQMLRALLADRFHLEAHNGSRPDPSLALVVAKGKHKLTEASKGGEPGCQRQATNSGAVRYDLLICRAVTMEVFAQRLRGQAPDYLSVPLTDQTGLKGAWDFDLKWTSRQFFSSSRDGILLSDALADQLGLALEPTTISSPVLMVDRVLRTPTPNAPNVTESLPPALPAEFEVAVIKPSAPGTQDRIQIQIGRADMKGTSLKRLIQIAYNDQSRWLAGEPSFLDSTVYDISAKSFPGESTNAPLEPDRLAWMLRALLIDRFKLSAHLEDREVSVYTLTAAKPKLNPANPALRTGCKTGPAPGNTTGATITQTTCQNVTMPEFVDRLQRIAQSFVDTPILELTGLSESFDFTFTYGLPNRTATPDGGVAADPTGVNSIFDALSKLGLKLEKEKHKMPVLVIDHIQETPTEN